MKTMIAVPCMDTVPTRFMTSLLAMRKVGEPCIHYFEMSSLIYDARNKIARAAIKEKCERVLWLDSDMEFEPDLMERLSARIDEGRESEEQRVRGRRLRIRHRDDDGAAA